MRSKLSLKKISVYILKMSIGSKLFVLVFMALFSVNAQELFEVAATAFAVDVLAWRYCMFWRILSKIPALF
jgi:hypothetical protein